MSARHHAYLQRELPYLCALALQVRGAHSAQDERLSDLVAVLARLRAELEAHMVLQQRMFLDSCGGYERELLERHACELDAEIATLSRLTDGFGTDGVASEAHRVLIRRLGALAADTEYQLRTERELMRPAGGSLSAA